MSAPIVIDGKGHIQGKLAAAIAKQLIKGRRVVVVRCEEIILNGSHRFVHHQYAHFLNKTTNSNPRHGPFHQRAPSEIFLRAVRGMLPYRTTRGLRAFENLKTFEGIPPQYSVIKRVIVPHALRIVNIQNDRATTKLGKLSTTYGWKYGEIVSNIEEKRKAKSQERFESKKEEQTKLLRAIEQANKQLGEKAVRFIENFQE